MASARLPVEGVLPSFDGATGWLNSPPLTPANLRGQAVLVNFWTYTCINWLRQLPYVRAWAEKYAGHGLVVIGVHTPEFGFEHDAGNVRRAVKEMKVGYPVAIDNDYAVWRAFGNHYWPALYLADAHGQVRYHHFGEGEYRQSEMIIQHLLAEAGSGGAGREPVSPDARGVEAAADWAALRSPENYTGYERTENFASPGGARRGRPHVYAAPATLRLNQWALSGDWTMGDQAATLNTEGGQIACRFDARDLHLVMVRLCRETRSGSRCASTGSRPAPRTASTSTFRAMARSPNHGCTSSSAILGPSTNAPLRSPSSTPALWPTPSPSAKRSGEDWAGICYRARVASAGSPISHRDQPCAASSGQSRIAQCRHR
jgi:thiol-disulfide isomerase/thioredoxin